MNDLELTQSEPADIKGLRTKFLDGHRCQIVRSSFVDRGLANTFLIEDGGKVLGYLAVANKYYPGRLIEMYLEPDVVVGDEELQRLARSSGASSAEAQSNMPFMFSLLQAICPRTTVENYLFGQWEDQYLFDQGEWRIIEDWDGRNAVWHFHMDDDQVGSGEILGHYNHPYVDIFMEVIPKARRSGYGAYIVQLLCRECVERGLVPSARCNESNDASRATLKRGGFKEIGQIESGVIR